MAKRIQKSGVVPNFVPKAYAYGKTREAYLLGWNHGHGIACHNVPSIGDKICRSIDCYGLGAIVTAENIAEYHVACCHAAADNSRQYSPFEFTAHEFNSQGDDADMLWEAFEAVTADAIDADLRTYSYEE